MNALHFWVNGREWTLHDVPPTTTLLRFLRETARLTGTKEGCAEGDCGACTVAVLEQDGSGDSTYRAVNSCLLLLPMVQGKRLFTVEGLAADGKPHLAQSVLTENLGSQCGYCTPGVVMSLFEACYRPDLDEAWKVDAQMCGNLCRCTGYRPIRDAAQQVAGRSPRDPFSAGRAEARAPQMALFYEYGGQRYANPTTLAELWPLLETSPPSRIVCGGTDLGLDITKRHLTPERLVSLEALSELRGLTENPEGFTVGAAVPLSELEDFFQDRLPPFGRMLRYFGARQIKNRATLGGNLCTASPIGDLAPVLLALEAGLVLLSGAGLRRVPAHEFFRSYRQTALRPGEILARVEIARPGREERLGAYKVSKRRELDISTVAAAFAVTVDAAGRVARARIAYGGMAAVPARATHLEQALEGLPWSASSLKEVVAPALRQDFQPISDHRGSAAYRLRLAENLLAGFFAESGESPSRPLAHPHTSTVQTG